MAEQDGQAVRVGRIGPILEIVLDRPPGHLLGPEMRQALWQALDLAERGDAAALVLSGASGCFSAGLDPFEMEAATGVAGLAAIADRIESFPRPVVALITGPALGAGLELALAAHLRLAVQEAQFAFPDVHLGLLPAAGGSQRLPRLTGGAAALDLLLSGRFLGAAEALACGLVDEVVNDAAAAAARAAGLALAQRGAWRRTGEDRGGFRDVAGYRAAVAAARAAQKDARLPAPARIVDCVEAALLLPLEQGLAFEATAAEDMRRSPESAGLRHAFRAERAARRLPPAVARIAAPAPQRVAFWGAGAAACGLARQALQAGLGVILADPSREVLVTGLETIAAAQEAEVQAGRMTPEARDADWARLLPVAGPGRLGEAEIVVMTRPDLSLAAPRTVLALDVPAPKGAVALWLNDVARTQAEMVLEGEVAPQRAAQAVAFGRRLGWSVIPVGPGGPVAVALATALAEAVSHLEGRGVPRQAIAHALALAGIAGDGRVGVMRSADDLIARRCLGALANAGARLVEQGTARDADTVDAVAIAAGIVARWTGGPMHQADRRGLLVLRRDLRIWAAEAPGLFSPAPLLDRLIAEGRGFGA